MEIQGNRVMIDTDVLIELVKRKLLSKFVAIYDVYISFVTLYEYIRGSFYKGFKPSKYKELLEESVIIIWSDNEILEKMAEIWYSLKKKGALIDERDLIIGTTAIVKDLPLITRNKSHFERLRDYGLKLADADEYTRKVSQLSWNFY